MLTIKRKALCPLSSVRKSKRHQHWRFIPNMWNKQTGINVGIDKVKFFRDDMLISALTQSCGYGHILTNQNKGFYSTVFGYYLWQKSYLQCWFISLLSQIA